MSTAARFYMWFTVNARFSMCGICTRRRELPDSRPSLWRWRTLADRVYIEKKFDRTPKTNV